MNDKPRNRTRWAWDEAGGMLEGLHVTSEWFPDELSPEEALRMVQSDIAKSLMHARKMGRKGFSPDAEDQNYSSLKGVISDLTGQRNYWKNEAQTAQSRLEQAPSEAAHAMKGVEHYNEGVARYKRLLHQHQHQQTATEEGLVSSDLYLTLRELAKEQTKLNASSLDAIEKALKAATVGEDL